MCPLRCPVGGGLILTNEAVVADSPWITVCTPVVQLCSFNHVVYPTLPVLCRLDLEDSLDLVPFHEQVGMPDGSLPPALTSELLEDAAFIEALHHVLMDMHVVEGVLVCPESGRRFPIKEGVPDLMCVKFVRDIHVTCCLAKTVSSLFTLMSILGWMHR